MPEIVVTLPNGEIVHHSLTLRPQDIGRDPSCAIQIDDATVSRRHADIRGDSKGRFTIRDLGSKNGTMVNNTPTTTCELHHGDEVTFGSIVSRFLQTDSTFATSLVSVEDRDTIAPSSISFVGPQDKLRLSQHRLEMLYEINDRLTGLRGRDDLLADIMKITIETFQFERTAIGIARGQRRGMEWPVVHNIRGADGEIKLSRTILRQALEEGQRVILSDTAVELADPTMSIVEQGTLSAMCVPIAYGDEILGVIYGDRITTTKKYTQEDVDFLAALARQVSIGLTNIRLMEEQQQKVFLEKEIAIARQIQSDLFPEISNIHPQLEIAALNEPGRQVSGDYYDVLKMADGCVGIVIADVVGKGVAAALIAANLQAAIRVLMPRTTDLAATARELNTLLYRNTDTSRFVTVILAVVDPTANLLRYVSAGHHAPMALHPDGRIEVATERGGLPFGIDEDTDYGCINLDLGPGPTTLFFYTDGLNEALNTREEEFGIDRIHETLRKYADAPPQELLKNMRQAVTDFSGDVPQGDDITMLAIRTSGNSKNT
ncbi:MAG: SpoIIE family protein phosphatase [Planctomycetes bacterium]|nr:SpoIIE family protein phosphatase [Planctomycetota bacterium]